MVIHCAGKGGRAVGPVLAYENNVENGILPPQSKSPDCMFRTSDGKKQENCKEEEVKSRNVEIGCKERSTGMNGERDSNPYMQAELREGSIDARLLQAQSRFVTAGAAAVAVASHRDVGGGMQLGLT